MKPYSDRMSVVINGGSVHVVTRKKCDYYSLRKYTRIFRIMKKFKQINRRKNPNG